jgi:hypothetical protein
VLLRKSLQNISWRVPSDGIIAEVDKQRRREVFLTRSMMSQSCRSRTKNPQARQRLSSVGPAFFCGAEENPVGDAVRGSSSLTRNMPQALRSVKLSPGQWPAADDVPPIAKLLDGFAVSP